MGSLGKWAAGAAVAVSLVGGSALAQEKTSLTTEKDKVSYAIGLDVGRSFEPVAPFLDVTAFKRGVQTIFKGGQPTQSEEQAQAADAALRQNIAASQGKPQPGMPPGMQPPAVNKEQVGLMLGERAVGPSLAPLKDEVDLDVLIQAMQTRFNKGTLLLDDSQAQATMQAFIASRQQRVTEKNRTEGAAFLSKNKTEKGVITTPSGLQYTVLRQGSGERPTASSRVRVNYEGKLLDGTVFDSSYQRGQPAEFPLNGVIAGWTEGLALMPVGSKFRFWIPSQLGYGSEGTQGGPIGPDATLTFDVELMGIVQ
ncbi:MAG: FKBP-type peptidyl-prolyl cis-trans isomerase [Pseudoxanthomonas sp.]